MICENKNIIYNDMEYNRYITDDRHQKSGESMSKKNSKFCNYNNCKKQLYTITFLLNLNFVLTIKMNIW